MSRNCRPLVRSPDNTRSSRNTWVSASSRSAALPRLRLADDGVRASVAFSDLSAECAFSSVLR
ncbi:hypothetical protein Rwratislav_36314 [Rhodococcus wratislaviensis IFP 2016]|nr:hypothetical protein Rwratislav_36314 [Rhodococcus wratislaviensis IFP 2016]